MHGAILRYTIRIALHQCSTAVRRLCADDPAKAVNGRPSFGVYPSLLLPLLIGRPPSVLGDCGESTRLYQQYMWCMPQIVLLRQDNHTTFSSFCQTLFLLFCLLYEIHLRRGRERPNSRIRKRYTNVRRHQEYKAGNHALNSRFLLRSAR